MIPLENELKRLKELKRYLSDIHDAKKALDSSFEVFQFFSEEKVNARFNHEVKKTEEEIAHLESLFSRSERVPNAEVSK